MDSQIRRIATTTEQSINFRFTTSQYLYKITRATNSLYPQIKFDQRPNNIILSALYTFVKRDIDLLQMWVRCSCASNHFSPARCSKLHGSENRFVESTKKKLSIHPMPHRKSEKERYNTSGRVHTAHWVRQCTLYVSLALPVRSASLHAVFCFRLNQLSGHCYFDSISQYLDIAIWVSNSGFRNSERVDDRGSCANNFFFDIFYTHSSDSVRLA